MADVSSSPIAMPIMAILLHPGPCRFSVFGARPTVCPLLYNFLGIPIPKHQFVGGIVFTKGVKELAQCNCIPTKAPMAALAFELPEDRGIFQESEIDERRDKAIYGKISGVEIKRLFERWKHERFAISKKLG